MAEYRDIVSLYPSLDATVEVIASALLSTVIFVLLFFILRGLSYLLCILIGSRAFKNKLDDPGYAEEKSYCGRNNKKLGALLGLACAFLSTMVLTSPLMGFLDIADTAIFTAEDILPNVWEAAGIDKDEVQKIKGYAKDIPGNVFYQFGGQVMFRSAASSEYYGKRVYLMREVDTVSDAVIDFAYVYTVLEHPELSHSAYIKYIHSLCDNINDLNICHALLADFISEEFTLWKNGSSNYFEKPDIPETLEYAFDCVVSACADSTPQNIRENTSTFLRIYAIILESGIVNYESTDIFGIISCLNNTDLIEKINAELAKNPNLSNISFATVAISILTKQIDMATADKEMRDDLMRNMAEAISIVRTRGYGSMDEKLAVLTSYTKEYFTDFGIDLSEEMAKYNADVFLNHFALGDSDILPEDVDKLLDSFRNSK
ncbi:MAG: hypothetical protein J6S71_04180 [Clostridia bacterium]|nr:hypothetical protein [Clostridia bacterium]